MRNHILLGGTVAAGALVTFGQLFGTDPATAPGPDPADRPAEIIAAGSNPDVYCLSIQGVANWSEGSFRAYSIGTTSCNQGDANLVWLPNGNQHPVIGQNMFRYDAGTNGHPRFEQLGQGWLKHGFCALDQTQCGPCSNPTGCSSLAPGCSDPYTASRNGNQGNAGPKFEVNATTGYFPYPPHDPSYSGTTARRLRARGNEVTNHPNARWFFEAQYVHPQDNPIVDAANAANNVSYREGTLSGTGALTGYEADTVPQLPAIHAWGEMDDAVVLQEVTIEGVGTTWVGSRAYDNGDGTWDYEYAVQNIDMDTSIGSFSVPSSNGAAVSLIKFKGVAYHSGEPFSPAGWPGALADGAISWATQTFEENENANAIRWGTLYNFRFTSDAAPVESVATLGYFKTDGAFEATIVGPEVIICDGDADGDGAVDFFDVNLVLSAWGPCSGCTQDLDGNEVVDLQDLLLVLSNYGSCP